MACLDWLYDDMRGQGAVLRALAVGMATVAERAYGEASYRRTGRSARGALCDPYSGKALKFRLRQMATNWRCGRSARTCATTGSDEWGPTAPVDVTLHFALEAAIEPIAKRTRKIE